ncbi:MAG: M28 family peptidase [Deltaproteobacteria bacterium]|nr:M28 family peptidase [Deltaproteobacteria bacterium]
MSRKLVLYFVLVLILSPAKLVYSILHCENEQLTPESIISHIRYLASDELEGRMSGTPGADKAAEYISSEFKKAGLKPLGDDNSYFQKFSFTKGITLGEQNKLEFEIDKLKTDLKLGHDFYTLSFSSSGQFSGEVVFAGYGISAPELEYDDYKGIYVRDKIVLVLRYTPEGYDAESPFYDYAALRYKAMNAREKGAKAIIFVTPYSQDEEEDLTSIGRDLSYSDSGIQSLILKREKAQELLLNSGTNLKKLEQNLADKNNSSFLIPITKAVIKTELIEEKGESSNVIGLLEGSDPVLKNEFIVIGAHYDHIGLGQRDSRANNNKTEGGIHNGADDNASGVAGLIELSEFFSCREKPLKKSLVFIAFSAEELGLIGASYYVDNPKVPLDKTIAMINMDMIGRLDKDKLTVFGVGSSPGWKELVNEANTGFNFEISLNNSGFAPSDQSVFFAKKIPVLHFFTGLHADYHAPSDDWEKINPAGERKVLKLISEIIFELNSAQEKIAFSDVIEPKKGSSKFNVYLGTIPDYSNQVEGVKLMGVRGGSPADKAGILGDDIIVQFNGLEIKNIYDYVYALGKSKAGVPTSLVVLRNYKLLSLIIIPEPR